MTLSVAVSYICFAYRLNQGNVKIPTMNRIDSLLKMCIGKRLMFAELIA